MDGIRKLFSKYLTVFLTGAILGLLPGIAGMGVLVSYRIDRYHQQIQYLQNIINERELKLNRLEESINKSKFVLKGMEVLIENAEGDELDKIELEKEVKKKYGSLIGREVKSIDAEMAAEVVDNRIMRLGNKEYKLSVNRLLISDMLKIWIEAKLVR